jgi:hypothetical protein
MKLETTWPGAWARPAERTGSLPVQIGADTCSPNCRVMEHVLQKRGASSDAPQLSREAAGLFRFPDHLQVTRVVELFQRPHGQFSRPVGPFGFAHFR